MGVWKGLTDRWDETNGHLSDIYKLLLELREDVKALGTAPTAAERTFQEGLDNIFGYTGPRGADRS